MHVHSAACVRASRGLLASGAARRTTRMRDQSGPKAKARAQETRNESRQSAADSHFWNDHSDLKSPNRLFNERGRVTNMSSHGGLCIICLGGQDGPNHGPVISLRTSGELNLAAFPELNAERRNPKLIYQSHQSRIAAHRNDQTMQPLVLVIIRLNVFGHYRGLHLIAQVPQFFTVPRDGDVLRRHSGRQPFKRFAHAVKRRDFVSRHPTHPGASIELLSEKSFGHELADGLAYCAAADAERRSQITLYKALVWYEPA